MTSRPDFDPITLEVVRNKLDGIANEMEMTLLRSSFSPIVKEGQDASASLFTISGETLAQATATPVHLSTLIPIVQLMLRLYPLEEMRPGDIYMMNDPYLGATHLPDIALVMPVFAQGRPVAISATMTHHQDVGGMSPGSIPPTATEIFQEGIRIPPLRYCREGKFDENVVKILRQNVRIPETFMGDLNAQVAACHVGARRIAELAESYGHNHSLAMFDELLDRSEALTRRALEGIKEGVYRYVDFNDNDGIELDKRIRFEVAVTVKGGTMHIDFTGSSPQVKGPFNCVPSGSQAAAYYAIRAITDPTIPTNGGCFRPVSLHLPEGSVVNPREPAPVNSRTATIKRVCGTILGALRDAVPDRIPADPGGELLAIVYGGQRPDGKSFVTGEMLVGGSGASMRKDGVDVIETDVTNCMNNPIEALETDTPVRVHRLELRQDSGGAGMHRGGLGVIKEVECLAEEVSFTHRGERHFCSASGAQGGKEGARARSVIRRADGTEEVVASKLLGRLRRGDRVLFETAGAGGFGDPAKRDRARVEADLEDGKISAAAAQEIYGFSG